MEQMYVTISLALLGLCFGSFAGATVWRLRSRQLVEDKRAGELVNEEEYKQLTPLAKESMSTDRSRCLRCGHTLAWYDLLPLFSWLSLRGRCRYCGVRIGKFELLTEIGVASAFCASYLLWPNPLNSIVDLVHFGLWLVAIILLAILFSYDSKWFLLPDSVVFPLVAVGVVVSVLKLASSDNILSTAISIVVGVAILSGIYLALWLISKGQWIGFGDVKLGLALALLLSDWRLAFFALFSANLIGTIVVIPGMLTGKLDRKAHVPFGPLLIAGTFVAMLFGPVVLSWYQFAIF